MKIVKTNKYSQRTQERRYYGSIELKIFVQRTIDEKSDYENAENILLNALKVLRENNIDANVSEMIEIKYRTFPQ